MDAYQRTQPGQKIDYQKEALRTLSNQFHVDMGGTQPRGNGPGERRITPTMLHAAIGMVGEAWELHFSTGPVNDREEVGDIYWFCAVMAEELGTTFQEAIGVYTGPTVGRHVVEQRRHLGPDPFAQALDAADGEGAGHQPAQPGVVGRVEREDRPGTPLLAALEGVGGRLAEDVERGIALVDAGTRRAQHGERLFVARHQ